MEVRCNRSFSDRGGDTKGQRSPLRVIEGKVCRAMRSKEGLPSPQTPKENDLTHLGGSLWRNTHLLNILQAVS